MSTRSTIGMKKEDGSIEYVYCHWDGYPSNNGKILLDHFTDIKKIQSLLDLGDISSLYPSIDKSEGHSFDTPIDGHTIFYGRDRGETDIESRKVSNSEDIDYQEYAYIFDVVDNVWHFSHGYSGFIVLTENDCID